MDGEETRTETPAPAPTAKTPRRLRLGAILQVVNTAALAALLAMQLLRPGLRHDARAEERAAAAEARAPEERRGAPPEGQPGPTLRLADFVVHLRDADADRYARVSFELELRDEKAKEAVTARLPQIRDAFLAYLSDRTSEEFRGSEAIARIKAALAEKLGGLVPAAGARALYLTELVVQ
mgnify:CR=1 FL=1|jgi:flagellar FliL protein